MKGISETFVKVGKIETCTLKIGDVSERTNPKQLSKSKPKNLSEDDFSVSEDDVENETEKNGENGNGTSSQNSLLFLIIPGILRLPLNFKLNKLPQANN